MGNSVVDLGAAAVDYVGDAASDFYDYMMTGSSEASASGGYYKSLGPGARQYFSGPGEDKSSSIMDYIGFENGGAVDLGAGSPEEREEFLEFLRKNRPVYKEGDERPYTYYSDMLMVPEEKRNTPEQEYESLPRAGMYEGFAEPSYGITLEDLEKGVANLSDIQDEAETGNPYAGTSGNFVPQQYEIVDGSVIANPVGFDDGGAVPVEEAGIGSFMYDMVTGNVPSDNYNAMRTSGRMDDPMAQAIYGQDPTFMEQLVTDYNYPANIPMQDDQGYAIMDPETGGQKMMMATDFNLPEYMRTGRPRPDMPTYGELEDARAHALASALMAKDYGPRATGIATKIKEATEMLPGFGSSGFRDMKMDNRNNALGVKLLKEAGIQSSPKELARTVDQAVFSQLDRILGRSESRQETPAKDQPFAKQYFKSPEGGLDVYFPRDKQGYFDTSYIYD
tara:strand:- start:56 stop:1402 length:1347 start_codon:yes stop_codon:yes gene_type:complete